MPTARAYRMRQEAKDTLNDLQQALTDVQAKSIGICSKREFLHAAALDRLIEQINFDYPEMASLLISVRNERRMTLACYRELHQGSLELGLREATVAETELAELSEKNDRLAADIRNLKIRLASLTHERRAFEASSAQSKALVERLHAKQIDAMRNSRRNLAAKQDSASLQQRHIKKK